MSLELDTDIYRWLISLSIIPDSGKQISLNRYSIPSAVSNSLENGVLFGKLAQSLAKQSNITLNVKLDQLKEFNTPAAKLYNWNLLSDAYKKLGVSIDPDMKSLLIAGDTQLVNELLKDIYQVKGGAKYLDESLDLSKAFSLKQSMFKSKIEANDSDMRVLIKKPKQNEKDVIDIALIDVTKDLNSTTCLLEFFIVALAKHLQLKSKQAASLFTRSNKYLAHVIVKGVKGQFEPIIAFYQDSYAHAEKILELLEAEDQEDSRRSVILTLQALKPGLISKNFDVALWCTNLLAKLSYEFVQKNLHTFGWEWFVMQNGGLQTCLLGIKRHDELTEQILNLLLQFGRFNIVELFTVQIKNCLTDPKDFLITVHALLKPLANSNLADEQLLTSGILDFWLDYALQICQQEFNIGNDTRIAAIAFVVECWLSYPAKFEENENTVNNFLGALRKASRDNSQVVVLSKLQDPFAPTIYKTLTFALIDNHQNTTIRSFIMHNFITVFENLETIPLSILIEPLVKQIQISENDTYCWNVFDFEFLTFLAKHEKLQIKNAIQLLDLLAKVYLNDIVFANISSYPIINIISRNLENETLQDFVIKFVKISLAMYFASEKIKKPKELVLPIYNQKAGAASTTSMKEMENEVISAQKRALIIEMIKQIIELKNNDLNEKIKPLIAHTNIQIKNYSKKNNKAMMMLLSYFGKPEELVDKYELDYYENLATMQMKNNQIKMESYNNDGADRSSISPSTRSKGEKKSKDDEIIEHKLRKQYGVGVKKKVQKLTKAEQIKLALLRNPKADPKVMAQIEDIKRNYWEKLRDKANKKEEEEKKLSQQKVKLRKQLEKRSIEQGVATYNQQDIVAQLIFPEGSRERELKAEQKHGLYEYEPFDLETEESINKELSEICFKKYSKIMKYLFLKYSNSGKKIIKPLISIGFSLKNIETFDLYRQKCELINIAELWNLLKEHDMQEMVKHELQMQSIVRAVNIKILDNKIEMLGLNYPGYCNFLFQVAVFSFPNLSHLPASFAFEALMAHFRNAEKARGLSTVLYDEPESTVVADKEVLKEFNKRLKEQPGYVLPEEKDITFEYQLPEGLKNCIPESFSVSYEIVNQIVNNILQRPLSFALKLEVSNYPLKTRPIAEEVAYVVEDLLYAVEKNKDSIPKYEPIKNKVILSKEEKQKESDEIERERNTRRKMRHQVLLKSFPKKTDKERLLEKKKKMEEKKKKELQKKREIQKLWKERAPEFEERETRHKEKKNEQIKTKEERQKEKERDEKKKRKDIEKEFEPFNKGKIGKMEEKFEQIRMSRDEEKKKIEETPIIQKKKWKEYNEKVLPKKFEEDHKKIEQHMENNKKIKILQESPEMQAFFKTNERQFKGLFNFLLNKTFTPLNLEGQRKTIPLQTMFNFATQFSISPVLITNSEILLLYNSLTKDHPYIDNVLVGLNYEEFLQALIRIAIKGENVFNQMAKRLEPGQDTLQEKEINEMVDDHSKEREKEDRKKNEEERAEHGMVNASFIEKNKNRFDEYYKIEVCTPETMEALLYYLGLPLDPNDRFGLENRLKEVQILVPIPNKMKKQEFKKKIETDEVKNYLDMSRNLAQSRFDESKVNEDDDKDEDN